MLLHLTKVISKSQVYIFYFYLAGVEGIEPPVAVLETTGLPLTDTPRDWWTDRIRTRKFAMTR